MPQGQKRHEICVHIFIFYLYAISRGGELRKKFGTSICRLGRVSTKAIFHAAGVFLQFVFIVFNGSTAFLKRHEHNEVLSVLFTLKR